MRVTTICAVLGLVVLQAASSRAAFAADCFSSPRIDSLYGAGYDPCSGGFFVSRGCTRAVPLTYRNFAPQVFPSVERARLGNSWYEGAQPIYPPACWWGPPIDSGVTFGPGYGDDVYVVPEISSPPKSPSENAAP